MQARSPHEPHRVATPLELFFDLVFVVAIARAAAGLHHSLGENHIAHGLIGFGMVFFAIWWAWMNFTWFASAYDCDDVPYRLAVFVQMSGALVMSAGIGTMFDEGRPNLAVLGGYVIMRIAAVSQWLRAARSDPARRTTARRYAIGVSLVQGAWLLLVLGLPAFALPPFIVLVAMELAVPVWAERATPTTWHPHHIAERYGLLTLIVLGESVLSATIAVQTSFESGERGATLIPLVLGGLLIVFSLWWLYFDRPVHGLLVNLRKAITWGYGHYLVFASAAAVGAGLAVAVDQAAGRTAIGAVGAGLAVSIPVVIFLLTLWALHDAPRYRRTRWLGPAAVPFILLAPITGHGVPLVGLFLAGLVTVKVALRGPDPAH